jgi:hypothetical protein
MHFTHPPCSLGSYIRAISFQCGGQALGPFRQPNAAEEQPDHSTEPRCFSELHALYFERAKSPTLCSRYELD